MGAPGRDTMLIIVCGLPGTGKTTFARAFASVLDAIHINSDKIRHLSQRRGRYDDTTKYQVYLDMLSVAETELAAGNSVVLDATFYTANLRELAKERLSTEKGHPVFIEILADEADILSRIQRKRQFSEADASVFVKIKEAFEPINEPHLSLNSSQDSIDEMTRKARVYLSQAQNGTD